MKTERQNKRLLEIYSISKIFIDENISTHNDSIRAAIGFCPD